MQGLDYRKITLKMAEESVRLDLLKHLEKVEESYSLQALNALRAGGVADYYVEVFDAIELATAVKAAIDLKIPYIVIGEADKILFSDGGFPGLVIHNKTSSIAVSLDKSQLVVDSGLPLANLVNSAVSRGLGGVTNFHGIGGTVGGAIYNNLTFNGQSFLSLVRYATLIVPPAKIDTEAKIVRYKRDWLEHSEGKTKLQYMRETKGLEAQPVILTALLQLTSVRPDELMDRIKERSNDARIRKPSGQYFGPIFKEDQIDSLRDILQRSDVHKIRLGGLRIDKNAPNFIRSKTDVVRSEEIYQLTMLIKEKVKEDQVIELSPAYECGGVW